MSGLSAGGGLAGFSRTTAWPGRGRPCEVYSKGLLRRCGKSEII